MSDIPPPSPMPFGDYLGLSKPIHPRPIVDEKAIPEDSLSKEIKRRTKLGNRHEKKGNYRGADYHFAIAKGIRVARKIIALTQ